VFNTSLSDAAMLHWQGLDATYSPIISPIFGNNIDPVDYACIALVNLPM